MIGKGKSIAHTSIAVDYARLKENAQELDRFHLAGETGTEIEREFRMCQDLNHHCERNTLQFIISPTVEDGKKLTQAEFRDIYRDFIHKMKLEQNQSVAFLHQDKKHAHIHVYANRIGFDGVAYKDSFISNRAAKTTEEIAQERGLTLARDVQAQKLEQNKDIIAEIKHRHEIAMKHHPRDLEDYITLMKANKVNVEVVQSKTGKVSGLRMEFEGNTFKASEIDRKLSYGNLSKQLQQITPSITENLNLGVKIAKTIVKTIGKSLDNEMTLGL
jgi:hypothetical protein